MADGYLVFFIDEEENRHYEKVFMNKKNALKYGDEQQKKKNKEGREVDFYVTRVDVIN